MYDTGPDGPLPDHQLATALVMVSGRVTLGGRAPAASPPWGFGGRPRANPGFWLLNGVALCAYGVIPLFWKGPLAFDRLALLLIAMAMTFGILALMIVRSRPRSVADQWFFGLAGAGSLGFAVAFLALVNRWIQLERRPFHPSVFLWLCVYFGFAAICILGLALRPHRPLFFR